MSYKSLWLGAGTGVQQVKSLLETVVSLITVPVRVPAALSLIQLPVYESENAVWDGSGT